MSSSRLPIRSIAGLLASLTLTSVSAQDGPAIEEIVVTAQKRTERLSDVPQSATAFSGADLSREGVTSLQDLAAKVPGIAVASSGGVGRQQITLRGISTGSDVAPTVGIYVDDVPYGSGIYYSGSAQLALELGSFDLQRVEVLRGPQGTLYGASAFGGVIKYVLEEPKLDGFSGRFGVEGAGVDGGDINHGLRGAVNVALIPDKLAVRATVVRNHDGGFVDNVAGGKNVDESDTSVGRLSLLGKPTDKLTVRAMVFAQDIDRDGNALVDYDLATGRPVSGELTQRRLLAEPFDQRFRLFSAGADYDLGFASLSATAAHQTIDTAFSQDVSAAYVPLLGQMLADAGFPIDASAVDGVNKTDKTTFEARLTSPSHDRFEWLAGLYYTKEDNELMQRLVGYDGGVRSAVDIGTFLMPTTYEEVAVYADATVRFSPKFDVTLGVRGSRDEQTFRQIGTGLIATSNPGSDATNEVATYLATARYHFDDGGMFYLRAASGYRPGGPNLIAFDPVTGDPIGRSTFKPDKLWNYEAGVKLRPAHWLSADASVFYIDWNDLQLFTAANGLTVTANGAGATSKGGEFSVTAQPLAGWQLTAAASYTDASLDEASADLGARKGERLPNIPRWSGAISSTYEFPILSASTGRVGATWRYMGEREASFDAATARPQYRLPSYDTLDLTAGVEISAWKLDLYAKNILDERGQISADTQMSMMGGPAWVALVRPRTVGIVLSRDF